MNNELREAAERMRNGDDRYLDRGHYLNDLEELAGAYLAEHQPDDGQIIDWEWLQEQEAVRLAYPDLIVLQNPELTIKIHCTMDGRTLHLTRGQVRLLLRALQ